MSRTTQARRSRSCSGRNKGKGRAKSPVLRGRKANGNKTKGNTKHQEIQGSATNEDAGPLDEVENDDELRDNSDDSDYIQGDDSESQEQDESEEDDSDFETSMKPNNNKKTVKTKPSSRRQVPKRRDGNSQALWHGVNGATAANGASSSMAATAAELANEAVTSGPSTEGRASADRATRPAGASGSGERNAKAHGASGNGLRASDADDMRYVCEIAKTGRAACRRCDEKIAKDALKVGVVTEGSWGPSTQWHHLQCTIFKISRAEDVEGFTQLDHALQTLLEQQMTKSQGEVDDMYEPISPNDLVRKEWTEKVDCPEEVMATLLPYQAEGLAWMLNQEKLSYRGGILADEMGMGKTLQTICTIVANRPNLKDMAMAERWTRVEEEMEHKPGELRGGTLVICPTIAIKQWQSELARFVKPGTLKVVVHHGAKRATLAEELTKANVVLTTYAIVENEHRKAYAGNKVSCPDCGKSLYPDKMFMHHKYFCGEGAERTEAQAKTQRKGDSSVKLKGKGRSKGNSVEEENEGDDDDDEEGDQDTGTTNIKTSVKGKRRGGGKGSRGKRVAEVSDDEGKTTVLPPAAKKKKVAGGRGKASAGKTSAGMAKGRGRGRKPQCEEDDEGDDGTTVIPDEKSRGKKGKGRGKAAENGKGKAKKRKKAAGESESEWSDSDEPDDNEEEDDGASGHHGRKKWNRFSASSVHKDAAFHKVLKDMMERRQQAEPGVLQAVRSWPLGLNPCSVLSM